jgi:hypothetical protein
MPKSVELIGPDGNRPEQDTPEYDTEYKLLILLRDMLDNVKELTLGLLWMEREPAKRGITTDTTPLSRLYQALPAFPYWPRDRQLAPEKFAEKILAEETPLLDNALLALRRMAIEDENRQGAPIAKADQKKASEATHSADFTAVNWFGTEYTFALGVQSGAVKALWEEWEKSGLGLHQQTIREAVDAERENFRMDKAFRNNPAFGTMIQSIGDGRYKLVEPIKK